MVIFPILLASIPGSEKNIKQFNWFCLVCESKIKISRVTQLSPRNRKEYGLSEIVTRTIFQMCGLFKLDKYQSKKMGFFLSSLKCLSLVATGNFRTYSHLSVTGMS